MLPAYKMAQMVYHRLIEDTARLQKEVVMQNMLNASFGPDALPANKTFRGFSDTLTAHRRDDGAKDRITKMNNMVEANIKLIEAFEKLFAETEMTDTEAFAAALAWEVVNGQ